MKKYEIIEQWFNEQFQNNTIKQGEKLPSESEISNRFSVSRNVVRQALANLRTSGQINSIDKIGSFRAHMQKKQNHLSGNIGIITYTLDSYIFPEIIRGSGKELDSHGYHLLLGHSNYKIEKESKLLCDFLDKGIDGLIIQPIFAPNLPNNKNLLLKIESSNIPVILIDNAFTEDLFSSVLLNDKETGRMAASYLIEKGHSDIGIITEDEYYPKIKRLEGAKEVLFENGIKINNDNIIITHSASDTGSEASYRLMLDVFSREHYPTAFFCTSDEAALGLIKAAKEKNLMVPEDISVIGYDNWHHELPNKLKLTTFEHPGETIGQMAARIIIDRLSSSQVLAKTNIIIQPRLIEGESVRKL